MNNETTVHHNELVLSGVRGPFPQNYVKINAHDRINDYSPCRIRSWRFGGNAGIAGKIALFYRSSEKAS